jgi:hypothetical protein
LKLLMERREKEAEEIRAAIGTMGQQLTTLVGVPGLRGLRPMAPTVPPPPQARPLATPSDGPMAMEGVEMPAVQEQPAEEEGAMEGVERGGAIRVKVRPRDR